MTSGSYSIVIAGIFQLSKKVNIPYSTKSLYTMCDGSGQHACDSEDQPLTIPHQKLKTLGGARAPGRYLIKIALRSANFLLHAPEQTGALHISFSQQKPRPPARTAQDERLILANMVEGMAGVLHGTKTQGV